MEIVYPSKDDLLSIYVGNTYTKTRSFVNLNKDKIIAINFNFDKNNMFEQECLNELKFHKNILYLKE